MYTTTLLYLCTLEGVLRPIDPIAPELTNEPYIHGSRSCTRDLPCLSEPPKGEWNFPCSSHRQAGRSDGGRHGYVSMLRSRGPLFSTFTRREKKKRMMCGGNAYTHTLPYIPTLERVTEGKESLVCLFPAVFCRMFVLTFGPAPSTGYQARKREKKVKLRTRKPTASNGLANITIALIHYAREGFTCDSMWVVFLHELR